MSLENPLSATYEDVCEGIQLGRGLGFRRRNARVVQSGARNTSDRRRFRSDGDQSSGYGYWFGGGRDRFRSRDAESTVRELPRRFRSLGRRSRRGSDGPSRTVVRDDCGDVAWRVRIRPLVHALRTGGTQLPASELRSKGPRDDTGPPRESRRDPIWNALEHIVVVGGSATEETSFAAVREYGTDYDPADTSSEDICAIQYTSGTTGDPKGVEMPHASPLALYPYTKYATDLRPDDTFLGMAPPAWSITDCFTPLLSRFNRARNSSRSVAISIRRSLRYPGRPSGDEFLRSTDRVPTDGPTRCRRR